MQTDTELFETEVTTEIEPENERDEGLQENRTKNNETNKNENFFQSRTITKVDPPKKKKRKFVPPYLAGDLSKKSNIDILKNAQSKKEKIEQSKKQKLEREPKSKKVYVKANVNPSKNVETNSKSKTGKARASDSNKKLKEVVKSNKSGKKGNKVKASTSGLNKKGGPILLEETEGESDGNFTDDDEV